MSISAATVRARIRDGWDPDVAARTPVRPKRPKGSPRKDYYQKKSRAPFDPYTTIGRFWAKVDKSGPTMPHMETPCWPWTASRLPAGYGLFYPAGRGSNIYAHRYAWALANGEDASDLHVLHACDNPTCCNPSHLRAGTHSDNMRDAVHRDRAARIAPQGEQHHAAKLDDDKVREIRRGGVSAGALARAFGVSKQAVQRVRRGKGWRHVTAP